MSVQAISWALTVKTGSIGGKAILLVLANYAVEDNTAWPSLKRLADETESSVDTVRRRLSDLENAGIIMRVNRFTENGRQTSNVYKLMMGEGSNLLPRGSSPARGEGSTAVPPHINDKKEQSSSLRSEDKARELDLDNSNVPEQKPKTTPRQELLAILDDEHAEAVIEHRKKLKAPLTVRAAKMLAAEFAKCRDPNAAADAMLMKGWRGFEADWLKSKGNFCDIAKPGGFSQRAGGANWPFRLEQFSKGAWSDTWGPKPGEPGYQGPPISTTTSKGASQ